jgi:hypothetical protein
MTHQRRAPRDARQLLCGAVQVVVDQQVVVQPLLIQARDLPFGSPQAPLQVSLAAALLAAAAWLAALVATGHGVAPGAQAALQLLQAGRRDKHKYGGHPAGAHLRGAKAT